MQFSVKCFAIQCGTSRPKIIFYYRGRKFCAKNYFSCQRFSLYIWEGIFEILKQYSYNPMVDGLASLTTIFTFNAYNQIVCDQWSNDVKNLS